MKRTKSKKTKGQRSRADVRLENDRKGFVEGIIAIVLSGGALPYFVRDCVLDAIESGKKALKARELDGWSLKHLNEIILGLELGRYTLDHLELIATEEDELKALRPHIKAWLEDEGYEFDEQLIDKILERLRGYWDKFDRQAWESVAGEVQSGREA